MTASSAIARLRELRSKATPGEWRANGGTYIYPLDRCDPAKDRIADCGGFDAFTNAAAVVAAMNALPALLECAEAAQRVVEHWQLSPGNTYPSSSHAAKISDLSAALDALASQGETK